MRKLLISSAMIMSCLMSHTFANSNSYTSVHTLGKLPIVVNKSSGMLDLTSLIKNNPRLHFAIKNPKTGEISYTHNAKFYGKNDGYYYQDFKRLQGFPVPTDLTSNDCKLTDVKAPADDIAPIATSELLYIVNLSASVRSPSNDPFDPNNSASYNFTTSAAIFDSLGIVHNLSAYYVKSSMPNIWTAYVFVDGVVIGKGDLKFDTSGQLLDTTGLNNLSFNPETGAKSPQNINLQFTGSTQFAGNSTLKDFLSNGMAEGKLVAFTLDDNGYISYLYNNGQSITVSKIAVFL